MPRGPLTEESKLRRAEAKIAEVLGYTVELEPPDESTEDKIIEAESVILYFEARGKGFKKIKCRNCEQIFAYRYHIDGVKHCSIACTAKTLKKLGLKWDPSREVERRWGRFVPAVVPPSALQILEEILGPDVQED